jgi:uncharacterized membrane protein
MAKSKYLTISMIIVALLFAIAITSYIVLPDEQIPTHWNSQGEVDDYSGKEFGLFLIPVFSLGLYLLFILLPKIDPLGKNIKKFINIYHSFVLVMILFFLYIYLLTLSWTFGYTFDFNLAFVPAIALLFIYLGIILPKIKRNWFIGIRTPWTLQNDRIWDRTHKLGGALFRISGFVILAGVLIPDYLVWLILAPLTISVVIVFFYSYLEYRKTNHVKD